MVEILHRIFVPQSDRHPQAILVWRPRKETVAGDQRSL